MIIIIAARGILAVDNRIVRDRGAAGTSSPPGFTGAILTATERAGTVFVGPFVGPDTIAGSAARAVFVGFAKVVFVAAGFFFRREKTTTAGGANLIFMG